MAAGEGFEPSQTESESGVLPLHKPAISLRGTSRNEQILLYKKRAQSQAPCARFQRDRLFRDLQNGIVGDHEFHVVDPDEFFILFYNRVFRLGHYFHERGFVERVKPHDDRHSSDEFGNKPELRKILRLNFVDISDRIFLGRFEFPGKAERRTVQTLADDFVKPYERAAADEQNVRGVYSYKILLRA